MKKLILPLVISQSNGILFQQAKLLPRVKETLQQLRRPISVDKNRQSPLLPFVFLEDGENICGLTNRIRELNLLIEVGSNTKELTRSNIVGNNEVGLQTVFNKHKENLILVAGTENTNTILGDYKLKNYITVEEFASIYPELVPVSKRTYDNIETTKQIVLDRTGRFLKKGEYPQISAVVVLDSVERWEECTQIICDILTTQDGFIAMKFPTKQLEMTVPVYMAERLLTYPKEANSDRRIAAGVLELSIKESYRLMHNFQIPDTTFKQLDNPLTSQLDAAVIKAKEQIDQLECLVGQIYFIGSNSDLIKESNRKGWHSICVKQTNYFSNKLFFLFFQFEKSSNNDFISGSFCSKVVKDFQDSIQHISSSNNLDFLH